MAVLIEGISVVLRTNTIIERYPGGWDAYKAIVPIKTLCADNEVARIGFMNPRDVEYFVTRLEQFGFVYLRDGKAIDVAVVDQQRGPTMPCDWLKVGHVPLDDDHTQIIMACQLAGSTSKTLMWPDDWQFEGSLSQSYSFLPSEHVDKALKFLRHENGIDVHESKLTKSKVYQARSRRWTR